MPEEHYSRCAFSCTVRWENHKFSIFYSYIKIDVLYTNTANQMRGTVQCTCIDYVTDYVTNIHLWYSSF